MVPEGIEIRPCARFLIALALLLPLGLATAEESNELGDLFKDFLRGGVEKTAPPATSPTRPPTTMLRRPRRRSD